MPAITGAAGIASGYASLDIPLPLASPGTVSVHAQWVSLGSGASFPGAVYDADDIPAEIYDPSFELLNLLNTPWMEWVDQARFDAHVATTESLPLTVVASAHGPVHRGDRIADAFRRTRALAGTAPAEQPGQDVLELLCAMLATAAV